ncbi:flagellar biosynthetic protein FliO [Variovorax sp. J22P240]|uniref:flagellar biosynthetic protein FliO n=1 Tax=unclassified Variovorax TaxID=663243 RepID=UPI003365A961
MRLSGVRLSPRHSLHVVCWEGRRLLVGCSDHAIQLLAESPAGPDAEATPMPVVGPELKGVPWAP